MLPCRNRNRAVRVKVRAAVHPPCAGQNQRESIRRVGVWSAHVAGIPLHQNEINPGLVEAAVERRHFAAVRRGAAPRGPLESVGKSYLSLRWINCARLRRRAGCHELQAAEEHPEQKRPAGQTNVIIGSNDRARRLPFRTYQIRYQSLCWCPHRLFSVLYHLRRRRWPDDGGNQIGFSRARIINLVQGVAEIAAAVSTGGRPATDPRYSFIKPSRRRRGRRSAPCLDDADGL